MAKINEYPLERFTFGDDDYYDIDYWDGAVYQSAKIKGSTIRAAMSGGGSILAADGQVMPADRSQDLANFKLSLRDGVFTLGTVDADFGSIFQATKDSGNTYATIKTKTNDNAALILDINTADVTGSGNKTAFIQFRDAGVSKYIFGTNTDGVANFSDNSFFISSSAQLTDYIQAIDRNTESFVIGRQVGNPLNDNTKFLINNGNSFDATELDNVLMLSSRDESKKWSVDKDMVMSHTKAQSLELTATDRGLLLNRVTTAQMNGIASPTTNEIVYNTDLNGLYRYDGAAWVGLSAGYGIIEVVNDGSNGVPVYFSDLQTALETCKTGNNIVTLYDNITLTTQINILSSGSGVGGGYQFESLTIDFNGFQIENNEVDDSYVFNISIPSIVEICQPIIYRRNGTGTHHAIKTNGSIDLKFSGKGYIFCQNERTIWVNGFKQNSFLDGGGVTVETSTGAYAFLVYGDNTYVSNFNIISGGVKGSFFKHCSLSSINAKHNGSEEAIWAHTGCEMLIDSNVLSTGKGVEVTPSNCVLDNNKIVSTEECIFGSGIINGGYYESTNDHAVRIAGVINGGYFYSVNGITADLIGAEINGGVFKSLNSIPLGLRDNGVVSNVVAISINDTCLTGYLAVSPNKQTFVDCKFISKYDNANGHSVDLSTMNSGTVNFVNCFFEVANSSANNIYSSTAETIKLANCTLSNATTAINANVTIAASTDLGNGNRQV